MECCCHVVSTVDLNRRTDLHLRARHLNPLSATVERGGLRGEPLGAIRILTTRC